jgi:phospholipase/carboxylesterase
MKYGFVETKPLSGNAKKLAILLHGVGSDAKDLAMIIPYMQEALPDFHFISLNGAQKYDAAAFGYQWFSFKSREHKYLEEEVGKTVPVLLNFAQEKLSDLSLDFEDLFLIGFSQGAMVATHVATSFDKKLGGIVAFSGTIIPRSNFQGNINTPICFIYGTDDEILSLELIRNSARILSQIGFNAESFEIPRLGHSIDLKGIQLANNFILKSL